MSTDGQAQRPDARDKVTGAARYTGDLVPEDALHLALVVSPVAAGTLRGLDRAEAAQAPGVVAVLGAAEIDGVLAETGATYGPVVRDRPILARERVRYVGEPVGLVLARSARAARRAAVLVLPDIDEEASADPIASAVPDDAPLVHGADYPLEEGVAGKLSVRSATSNVAYTAEVSGGDLDAARAAAVRTLRGRYRFPSVYHYAMEPFACIARADRDRIAVTSTAQHPYQVQRDLARLFGQATNRVSVDVPYIGGGFGSKSFTHVEPLVTAAAMWSGTPVSYEADIEQAVKLSRRHGATIDVEIGLGPDGEVTFADVEGHLDTGAYALTGPIVAAKCATRALGPYRFPAYRSRIHLVYTNTSPAGSFRAIGGPQGVWAIESHMDAVARALGEQPLELRRRLLPGRGDEFRAGRSRMDADLRESVTLLDGMIAEFGHGEVADGGRRTGVGVGAGVCDPGASPVSTASVKLSYDGSVLVSLGTSELGQGAHTVLRQVAADALALPVTAVRVVQAETAAGPYDSTTGASRSTSMSGLAVERAAADLLQRLRRIVSEQAAVDAADVEAVPGGLATADGRRWGYGALVCDFFGEPAGSLVGNGYVGWRDFPGTPLFWEVAFGAARVSVDPELATVRVEEYAAVADVGKVMNHGTLEGQERGSIAQGLGHTLFEELQWDAGEIVNSNLLEYRVPRTTDMPRRLGSAFIENHDGPGPDGAKGGGEGGILPVAPAVAGAIEDATGVRVTSLPIRPDELWRALRDRDRDDRASG